MDNSNGKTLYAHFTRDSCAPTEVVISASSVCRGRISWVIFIHEASVSLFGIGLDRLS